MTDPNVFEPSEWDLELPEAGVRARRVGAAAGAQRLGATLYEVDPGGAVSPYHLHQANEEMLVVVAGNPSVRTPGGVRRLDPGAVLAFRTGPDGAHRIFNASSERARVLMISTMVFPEVAQHVDTGTWLTMDAGGETHVFPPGTQGEIIEAMRSGMAEGARRDAE